MVRPVNRDTVLWTLVLFFGASVMFGAIRSATEDEGTGVSLSLQLFAGLLLIGAVILFVRRRK
jgi:LPXTG-motif cell wall-anchored protein